jgi:tRNA G10  N-methylase Trm11
VSGSNLHLLQLFFSKGQKLAETPQILDPFCGTGTVLQEAILKGFKAHGTDLSDKMIEFSQENIAWLMKEFRPHGEVGEIFQADATEANWDFSKNLQSVVCETYLGQPFSAPPSPKKLAEVRENCNRIISNFLKNLATQIPEGTQICIAVPAWKTQNGTFSHLPLVDFLNELGYNRKEFMRVKNRDLIYYREDQVVARELLVLIRSKNVKS